MTRIAGGGLGGQFGARRAFVHSSNSEVQVSDLKTALYRWDAGLGEWVFIRWDGPPVDALGRYADPYAPDAQPRVERHLIKRLRELGEEGELAIAAVVPKRILRQAADEICSLEQDVEYLRDCLAGKRKWLQEPTKPPSAGAGERHADSNTADNVARKTQAHTPEKPKDI